MLLITNTIWDKHITIECLFYDAGITMDLLSQVMFLCRFQSVRWSALTSSTGSVGLRRKCWPISASVVWTCARIISLRNCSSSMIWSGGRKGMRLADASISCPDLLEFCQVSIWWTHGIILTVGHCYGWILPLTPNNFCVNESNEISGAIYLFNHFWLEAQPIFSSHQLVLRGFHCFASLYDIFHHQGLRDLLK